MNAVPEAIPQDPAVTRWRARFAEAPQAAVGDALCGRVSFGRYNRDRAADALLHLIPVEGRAEADRALQAWLAFHLGEPAPEDLGARRFAAALVEAFQLVVELPAPETRAWAAKHHGALRNWLRTLYFGTSRDPEAALYVALAHNQFDRSLLHLWLRLCRLSGGALPHHAHHALNGLRLMPADDQGGVEHGLPKALLSGLLDYAEALVPLVRQGERKGDAWHREIDFLAARYPMSEKEWGRRFRTTLRNRKPTHQARKWLDQHYPSALRQTDRRTTAPSLLPEEDERKEMLRRLRQEPLDKFTPHLSAFLDRYRKYTQESGDSHFLVRTYCNVGDRILERDASWARELAHEAARWAPSDPNTWSLLARAMEREGDWRRAEAVLWHARRRFPHDPHRHTQLARALILHDHQELGEAVYREAIPLFPDDPVCGTDLAHALRLRSDLEGALALYEETQEMFPKDPVVLGGLAGTLIAMNRLKEAEETLDWAEQVAITSDKDQRVFRAIRSELGRVHSGQSPREHHHPTPPQGNDGDLSALADITGNDFSHAPALGRATLLRRQANGGMERARDELTTLPEWDNERLVEEGLLLATTDGWGEAAGFFDARMERYGGDGVFRVHRNRAHARLGEEIDWTLERKRFPHLKPVIATEANGRPIHYQESALDDDELESEERLARWFSATAADAGQRRDWAEEDLLAAYHTQ